MKIKPTQKFVRELLNYDPETGVLTWRERDQRWIDIGLMNLCDLQTFNKSNANKRASTLNGQGYRYLFVLNKRYQEHRIIWLWMTGEWPEDQIDHINGIRDDNRWENLRCVFHAENMRNKSLNKLNKTGVNGVNLRADNGKFRARIGIEGGKRKNLGDFDSLQEAAEAVRLAKIEYGYHDNHGKPRKIFPDTHRRK